MNNLEIIILDKKNITDFAEARNELLRTAKAEWVFFLDSDEKMSNSLKKEIREAIKNKDVNGYFVTRRDYIFGKELKHGELSSHGWFGNARILRLARRNSGKWERSVHEYWHVKGKIGLLKNPLLHYPHQDLRSFIQNIDYFSTLHAEALRSEGKKSNFFKITIWPPGKFIYNYFFRLGFLDGVEGFVVALMMSFHSFLSWTKLYFLYS